MRFSPVERSGLALILLLFGTMLAMYITEQVTHRPVSPVWQVPLGGIMVFMGTHIIHFRQEIVDARWNNWAKRQPWLHRTGDPHIDPVFMVPPGVVVILFGIFMMASGLFALM